MAGTGGRPIRWESVTDHPSRVKRQTKYSVGDGMSLIAVGPFSSAALQFTRCLLLSTTQQRRQSRRLLGCVEDNS